MSKPKFSIGEFVYSAMHRTGIIFYIYNYRKGRNYPYSIFSLETCRCYRASAKSLEATESITDILNFVIGGNATSFTKITGRAIAYKKIEDDQYKKN